MTSKLLSTSILDQKREVTVTVTVTGMAVSQQPHQDAFIKLNCAAQDSTGAILQTRECLSREVQVWLGS